MEEQLRSYCRRLRFGADIVDCAKHIKCKSHIEFMAELFRQEIEARDLRRINRLLRTAGFDVIKTFEDYSFQDIVLPPTISPQEIMDISFIDRKENLVLYGRVGAGKTHLAVATGIAARNRGKVVKFFRTAALVNRLVEHKRLGTILRFMNSLNKADLIIFDEWGYVPLDSDGAKLLFQVVADWYERKSIILTTNLEFSKWNDIFYDDKLTAAIIDRIVHHSHLLDFSNRDSRRLLHSLMNRKQ